MGFPRILVGVGDDVARRAIVSVARGFNLDIIEAHTGRQVYAALIVGDAELGFIDLDLPDMSVYDIVRRVQAAHLQQGPKLIAVSDALSQIEDAAFQRAGFHDHVVKPIDPDRITALLFAMPK